MEVEHAVGPAEFTRRLLGQRQKRVVALPLQRTPAPGGAPRMQWLADAVKRDALGWLVREGGWRTRHVVVGGRRREGRIWDPAIFSRLGVRFTAGPLHLLVAAMETHAPIPRLPARTQIAMREGISASDPATGDLLALHRIISTLESASSRSPSARQGRSPRCPGCGASLPGKGEALTGLRGEAPARCPGCKAELNPDADSAGENPHEALRLAELRALSPLTLAFEIEAAGDLEGGAEAAANAFAPLFEGDRAALMTYLDRALATAWLDAEAHRRKASPRDALARYAAAARGMRGYVTAARNRPDALRPLISFYVGYVVRRFGGRAPVFEALSKKAQGFNRASERQEFLRTAGELFSFGCVISDAVDEALAAPFVDRTEEQKVLLADFHERYKDVAPEVEAIRRELVGEIG